MTIFLNLFILIPLLGFIVSLAIPEKKEGSLSATTFITVGIQLFYSIAFTAWWLLNGHHEINIKDFFIYKSQEYEFFLDFTFDKIVAVYLLVGAILTFLVAVYSRYYLHREKGYKRFFNTVLFFYLGYNITIFSGNFETLFLGWEILGISSFLLIAFYRERYLPVRNAYKVFSIYRIGDIGLILAMWMSHHLWHENITFEKLNNASLVHQYLLQHSVFGTFISLMILISAVAKSAQLPFSSWLPRAMEGPTPSSAIFYGSLSVHIGVFLLLRTYPFWEYQTSIRVLIGLIGLTTAFVATGIARVQSSVKSQIAYASIAQIGLIFIEVALGFSNLALFHFAGNAFLRTYQLLVSPSIVSYLIREQFYNYTPQLKSIERFYPIKLRNALYILCLKEWNLDSYQNKFLWNPIKALAKKLTFFSFKNTLLILVPVYLAGIIFAFNRTILPPIILHALPIVFSLAGLMMVLKSYTEKKDVWMSWIFIIANHFWIALALAFNEKFSYYELLLYLSGIFICGALGIFLLGKLKKQFVTVDLNQFHGNAFDHPKIAFAFLIACLGLTGFPITPTFVGEDLIFSHIRENQYLLAAIVSVSFVIDGLSTLRIYTRVFLGPHSKSYTEIAYKSS
jgi:NADH-quinone oxidoreductase subunit L